MSILTRITDFLSLVPMQPVQAREFTFEVPPTLEDQLARLHRRPAPWKIPSVADAMGVPAIQRAVTLIANTTGSLSLQAFRNGALMDTPPQIISRPDPFRTPRDAYRDMAYQLASRGETVLLIATRDPDGTASALIVVPLNELTVEENPRNRLYPIYTWGDIRSTRYSPANPDGKFVHITYLKEPGALRGVGPLQMAGAATSVAVEAQAWAARFYATGGKPSTELHTGMDLDEDESELLLAQWQRRESNMVQVTTGDLEVRDHAVNEQGAQMLGAREFNNGDAARLFGIPGMLMEYNSPGSSLTYQNVTDIWTSFVRGCLAPNYLEPIEQGLGDLLPRSIVTRFYVEGLLRADIKTRYDVYESGIGSGVLTPEQAQAMEGLVPGSPELAPVKPTPPAAVPSSIPFSTGTPTRMRTDAVRCDGRRVRDGRMVACNKLLAEVGPFVGTCPRCKKVHQSQRVA